MNKSKRRAFAAGAVTVVLGMSAAIGAQTAPPGPLENLTRAKAVFERACSVCHGLQQSLTMTFDKAGWEATVERMHDNGAETDAEERGLVVAYLLAKNTFEAKCSACHEIERPLGANKAAADWLSTVRRMAGKQPGHLTEEQIGDIAAYLALTRPLP